MFISKSSMALSPEELGARFIVTYYRLIYRDPDSLVHLFDPSASISRIISSEKSQLSPIPGQLIAPIDPDIRILKVLTYSVSSILGNLVVSVFGEVGDIFCWTPFTQQFILKESSEKWIVVADTYYEWGEPRADLVSADSQSETVKGRAGAPYSATREKKATVDELDASRTATISDLPRQYQGDDLVRLFAQYGVSRQFYTVKTVYLEFETVKGRDDAVAAAQPGVRGRPMYKGSYVSIMKGVLPVKGSPRA